MADEKWKMEKLFLAARFSNYRFRGRDPKIEALMKKRGFPVGNGKS